MKYSFAIILLSILSFGQISPDVNDFEILTEKTGDLDNDGIAERVIIYETDEVTDYGNVRVICIQKMNNEEWVDWRVSRNAILKSEEGGQMGDPFEGIEIDKGVLSVSFFGGSSWKWSYTDKYRFQNNQFKLIGYTSTYFKLCEYWNTVDFNLSTGKLISKKEYEKCDNQNQEIYKRENEIFFKKGIVITLKNRHNKELQITTPKYGRKISIKSINK